MVLEKCGEWIAIDVVNAIRKRPSTGMMGSPIYNVRAQLLL